jgi:translation initiation factor 4E
VAGKPSRQQPGSPPTQVEDFWRLYVHLRRPVDDRPTVCDYHVFREGIKPMWEDETNVNGGKWIVRLQKGVAARYWEDLLLALVGGQFRVGDEICGAVLSVRYQEDILSVWNKSADSRRVCMQIRDTLRSVLALPIDASLEYKKHTDSMRDNSSYRNANANFGEKGEAHAAREPREPREPREARPQREG